MRADAKSAAIRRASFGFTASCTNVVSADFRPELDGQAMKVAAAINEANGCLQRLRIDELRERHVAELELAGDADHVAIEPLFGERAESPQSQLATEDDVERVRRGAA